MQSTAVLKTLNYFSIFEFPLTAEELFFYLWQPEQVEFTDFLTELENFRKQDVIAEQNGFYFLPGNEKFLEKRADSVLPTERKLKSAQRAARILRFLPFLKAIFVCNSVASETSKPESDIDFFIVATAGRLWLVRFFSNLILRLFRLRTYGGKSADRVCLSFYISENHLDLSRLRIREDDIYLAVWLKQLLPMYDPGGCWRKIQENNRWVSEFLPHTAPAALPSVGSQKLKYLFEKLLAGKLGSLLENVLQKIQWCFLKSNLKQKTGSGSGVVISKEVLKFHEHDAREKFYGEWKKNCSSFVIPVSYVK